VLTSGHLVEVVHQVLEVTLVSASTQTTKTEKRSPRDDDDQGRSLLKAPNPDRSHPVAIIHGAKSRCPLLKEDDCQRRSINSLLSGWAFPDKQQRSDRRPLALLRRWDEP
jgi:hypothetical protein